MSELIRDAPIGQFLRYITNNRILLYPEEKPDFQLPASYLDPDTAAKQQHSHAHSDTSLNEKEKDDDKAKEEHEAPADVQSLASTNSREPDLEAANTVLAREVSRAITPQRTKDGYILVDWYTSDDQLNPQNWSSTKKFFSSLMIYIYTFSVYMGSSIVAASEAGIAAHFHVGVEPVSLILALYVLAYGMGPLFFSPLSEIPSVGRNPPYMITFFIFVIISIPTALVDNFAGLLVLRFLQGFFGSPCLATGGASLSDIYTMIKFPYVMCIFTLAATCGPAFGPVISGFSVSAETWRWSLWEILWLAVPVLLLLLLFLPETYAPTLLLRRAQRLRKLTGSNQFKSQSELDQANMQPRAIAFEALVRPIQLMIMDPSIAFTAVYIALVYAIYYSFFEAFPLVYMDIYHFSLGELGLVFISITVGVVLAVAMYWSYLYFYWEKKMRTFGPGEPEENLIPALVASFCCPVGLLLFGWTAREGIHWIVSVVGILIFTIGIIVIMQCIFVYLPVTYPRFAASLFAGNDFARSTLAFAAVLFSRPMYVNLGIGPGCSLLAGLTAGCIVGVYVLYFFGKKLRARSKFSAK